MQIKTCAVAAISRNNVIGNHNTIPWKIPSDFKWFKELTKDHPIIMGRNTWNSLPKKPLPSRYNIICTSSEIDLEEKHENWIASNSPQRCWQIALFEARRRRLDKVFVIGGQTIYNHFWPLIDEHYITLVQADVEGDTFYPELDSTKYDCEPIGINHSDKDQYETCVLKFTKIKEQ